MTEALPSPTLNTYAYVTATGQVLRYEILPLFPSWPDDDCDGNCYEIIALIGMQIDDPEEVQRLY